MKRLLYLILTFIILLGLTACGSSSSANTNQGESSTPAEQPKQEIEPLTEIEVKQMYSNPKDFVGRRVELVGKVFSTPEYDKDGVYFQMWGDPENSDLNTVVAYFNPEMTLNGDEYVRIVGEVTDVFEGENMMGGKIIAPGIRADSLEVISYMDAVAPTLYTATATTSSVDQYGYVVTIQKVELAESETRAYVSITNNGSEAFDLYKYSAKIIQNGKQYEQESNYNADYPDVQGDLSVGVTTEGIITFPAIESAPFQIIIPGRSENWNEEIKDYVFDFTVQE